MCALDSATLVESDVGVDLESVSLCVMIMTRGDLYKYQDKNVKSLRRRVERSSCGEDKNA
jgi:hypothetical protein